MLSEISKVAAVILAAGKGTRLNCVDRPKVMLEIGGKPIVSYSVATLKAIGFQPSQICLVVGFKKEHIENYFKDSVCYAVQEQQLGTAHAAYTGIIGLPNDFEHVMVMGGDDGAFYSEETIRSLIEEHLKNNCVITVLSAKVKNPASFGRIARDGDTVKIVEKEYLTPEQQSIDEVNTGTYIFNRGWFEKNFPNMPKMSKLGEYGMNPAITMAQEQNQKVQIITLSNSNEWHGINTSSELELADKLKNNLI